MLDTHKALFLKTIYVTVTSLTINFGFIEFLFGHCLAKQQRIAKLEKNLTELVGISTFFNNTYYSITNKYDTLDDRLCTLGIISINNNLYIKLRRSSD